MPSAPLVGANKPELAVGCAPLATDDLNVSFRSLGSFEYHHGCGTILLAEVASGPCAFPTFTLTAALDR